MPARGTPKSDALVVARISIDFLKSPTQVQALAALVHEASGKTVAWTEASGLNYFSLETLEKIQELRALMERDVAKQVLHEPDEPTRVADQKVGHPLRGLDDLPEGIGEHLAPDDHQI